MTKLIPILIFVVIHLLFGLELGYTALFPIWPHFTYPLQHANWVHLIVNSISFFIFFRLCESRIKPWLLLLVVYVIAVVVSFFYYAGGVPVVGASGMIYAMVGIVIGHVARRWFGFTDVRKAYIFFSAIVIAMLVGFLNKNTAGLLHVYAAILGYLSVLWGGLGK